MRKNTFNVILSVLITEIITVIFGLAIYGL